MCHTVGHAAVKACAEGHKMGVTVLLVFAHGTRDCLPESRINTLDVLFW